MNKYESPYELGSFFRPKAANYIQRCHLEDGGYFFARIPPSSGLDTYFAIKSLSILGVKPDRPRATADFFFGQMREGALDNIIGVFAAVEVTNELGRLTDDLKSHAQKVVLAFQNNGGGFGVINDIDVEIASELEQTYRAVKVLKTVGASFEKAKISQFVSSFLNADGGYGRGYSTLASTFYASKIQKLLGSEGEKPGIRAYIRGKENEWKTNFDNGRVDFLENLYWLVKSLANAGEKTVFPDRVIRFVAECRRPNGGFSRAMIMGIPTLEYTYYALSILRETRIL